MLLDYLAPFKARREVWKALGASEGGMTIRALALRTGLPYSSVHRELMSMKEAGLLRADRVGKAWVCSWDPRNPLVETLTALLGVDREAVGDERVYASLKSWGAGLSRKSVSGPPLSLEETLAWGVGLARRDPDVAQSWPVVLAKHRRGLDLDRLERLVRRRGEKRALGFLLSLAGEFLGDRSLVVFANRFQDRRVRGAQDFFTARKGGRLSALTEANTPPLARRWCFRMNTRLESFRSHFDKFAAAP